MMVKSDLADEYKDAAGHQSPSSASMNSAKDQNSVCRPRRKVPKFLSPTRSNVAEQFTGRPGRLVNNRRHGQELPRQCRGQVDAIPEQAFLPEGRIEESPGSKPSKMKKPA